MRALEGSFTPSPGPAAPCSPSPSFFSFSFLLRSALFRVWTCEHGGEAIISVLGGGNVFWGDSHHCAYRCRDIVDRPVARGLARRGVWTEHSVPKLLGLRPTQALNLG